MLVWHTANHLNQFDELLSEEPTAAKGTQLLAECTGGPRTTVYIIEVFTIENSKATSAYALLVAFCGPARKTDL